MTTTPDHTGSAQDAARQEAAQVRDKAQGAAQDVADTAREEVRQVTAEATDQFRSLASSAQDEFYSQAATQQKRLAEQSRTVTDDLHRLARGERPESPMVNQIVSMLAERAEKFTTELDTKQPAELLDDVRRFAARRPGTFLAIAAGVGLVAGRLTRGLSDSEEGKPGAGAVAAPTEAPQPTITPPPVAPPHTPVGEVPGTGAGGYPGHMHGTPPVGFSDTPIGDSLGGLASDGTGQRPGGYRDDVADRGEQR